jgi:hypothetical protein
MLEKESLIKFSLKLILRLNARFLYRPEFDSDMQRFSLLNFLLFTCTLYDSLLLTLIIDFDRSGVDDP